MTAAELQKAIDRAGYSQAGAAREMGIDRRTLMRYLSGEYPVPRLVELAVKALPAPHQANRR